MMPLYQRVLRVVILLALAAAVIAALSALAHAQNAPVAPEVGTLEVLARVFGPVGAIGLLLASVVGFFYRRDVLGRAADAERREDRFVEVLRVQATAGEKLDHLAAAIEHMVEAQQHGDVERARQMGELLQLMRPSR